MSDTPGEASRALSHAAGAHIIMAGQPVSTGHPAFTAG